jgi:hypothetical protein
MALRFLGFNANFSLQLRRKLCSFLRSGSRRLFGRQKEGAVADFVARGHFSVQHSNMHEGTSRPAYIKSLREEKHLLEQNHALWQWKQLYYEEIADLSVSQWIPSLEAHFYSIKMAQICPMNVLSHTCLMFFSLANSFIDSGRYPTSQTRK